MSCEFYHRRLLIAKWLGFIDEAGAERPRQGKHSVEDVVSHLPKTRAALAVAASELQMRAQARLESLPKVRTGRSQVHMEEHDLDWYVYLVEGQYGKGGSAGIEAEHGILSGAVRGMEF